MADCDDDFQELLRQVADGSEVAAWTLVDRYGEAVRRAVRRALSERLRTQFDSLDFVQLVWKSFFSRESGADRFRTPAELVAYLATMARYKVGMEARRRLMTKKHNLNREVSMDAHEEILLTVQDAGPGPMDVAIARERWSQLIDGHPAHYRRILQMKLQGHTCVEIAKRLQIDESTVRRFLKRLVGEVTE